MKEYVCTPLKHSWLTSLMPFLVHASIQKRCSEIYIFYIIYLFALFDLDHTTATVDLIVLSVFVGRLHSFIVWEKGIGDVETGGRLVFTPLTDYPAMGNFTFELVAESHERTEHNLLFPESQETLLSSTPRVLYSQKNVATTKKNENYHFSLSTTVKYQTLPSKLGPACHIRFWRMNRA